MDPVAVAALLLAFAFTVTNGFQNAATIAATFIASRSASPRQGIILVAGMSALGVILGGSAVAFTLSALIEVTDPAHTLVVLLVALASATAWNLATWSRGLPSSSTQALIGGLIGAAVAGTGIGSVNWGIDALTAPTPALEGVAKVLILLAASVGIGFAGGDGVQRTLAVLLRNAGRRAAQRRIIAANWAAALGMAFFNGANDGQKQLGMVALVLFAADRTATLDVPLWARAVTALLLGLGTLGGGWRVMNTLGHRIFRIAPVHSLSSQASSGLTIAVSTLAGAPVSSSQIVTSSVIGVGAAENPRRLNWRAADAVVIAMITTIPATAALAAVVVLIVAPFAGM
ncbi:MAG TPA: inorganic phosphate transporter [Methanoregulaceae archaeon]|nr:inorganic phosphate transporter [Methanoregulaceae archaeon]